MRGYRPIGWEAAPAVGGAAAGAWEAVGGAARIRSKPQQRAGTAAGGSRAGGPAGKAGASSGGKQKEMHTCERPECGTVGRAGFRRCGRCQKVWYCTPACLASDWERHQTACDV